MHKNVTCLRIRIYSSQQKLKISIEFTNQRNLIYAQYFTFQIYSLNLINELLNILVEMPALTDVKRATCHLPSVFDFSCQLIKVTR